MRILQISQKPPYPIVDGGCMAMADLAGILHLSGHSLKLFSTSSNKHPYLPSAFPSGVYKERWVLQLNSEASKLGALMAFLLGNNYITERFRNTSVEQNLKEILEAESFDMIILESAFTGVFLNLIRRYSKARVVLRSHNIEHRLWQKRIGQFGVLEKRMMKKWVRKFKQEEIALWKNVDAVLSISEHEGHEIIQHTNAIVEYFPLSLDITPTHKIEKPEMYFIGAMDWEPNREAMTWFCAEIWPPFHQKNPDKHFHLAGKGLRREEFNEVEGIVNYGFVEKIDEFLRDKSILINPLKTGQGIRIKALEAIGKGKVIISTSAGMKGLPFAAGEHYLCAETPHEFVTMMEYALSHADIMNEMVSRAREVAHLHFSKEVLREKLENTFSNIPKPSGV